jgi:N-acylneuraminate cytidylyltransferase/CMP-N,N'-diacetyllegionaminic acid synthase
VSGTNPEAAAERRLCTICARAGSKGVPDKNIRPLFGKPLVAHSVEQALASRLFALVAVSSDSPALLAAAKAAGADLLIDRPAEMAHDAADKLPAIQHAWQMSERLTGRNYTILTDLDCTAPLRLTEDIAGALALVESGAADNAISVAPARHSPYFNLLETNGEGFGGLSKPVNPPIVRRQDAPPCYDINASIYVWRREAFLAKPYLYGARTRLYVMPPERSVDIDSELDFQFVEFLMGRARAAAGARKVAK